MAKRILEAKDKQIWLELGGKRAIGVWEYAKNHLEEAKRVLSCLETVKKPLTLNEDKPDEFKDPFSEDKLDELIANAPLSNSEEKNGKKRR